MVHTFEQGGYRFALDVNSGAVHMLDALSYKLLTMLPDELPAECPAPVQDALCTEGAAKEELAEAYAELLELREGGLLFSADDYEPFALNVAASPVKAMCLNIAHDCNLRCAYCFAGTGDFGQGRRLMSEEVGRRAVDFLLEHSEARRNLELDFFGGEPLMNFDVVKAVVRYARGRGEDAGKKFRFTITTNGLLLDDDTIKFINREMSNVVLSIDGGREVHDALRKTVGGQGSYDIVLPKFQKLVRARGDKDYYVRGTFTRRNMDFTEDVLHLWELGFEQISLEPVVGDETQPYALREEDLPALFAEYEKLAQTILAMRRGSKKINFFHFMLDLEQGPCVIKRLRGCGCGNEYLAATPDGDLYPCHQFVGMAGEKMGNLLDGTFDERRRSAFAKVNVYTKEKCRTCWAKFYCSGGCDASNLTFQGRIGTPHPVTCALEKKRTEYAIFLQAAYHNSVQ